MSKVEAMSIQVDSGNPDFDKMLLRMAVIHKAKNHDYSKPEEQDYYANFRETEALGLPAWKGCCRQGRIHRGHATRYGELFAALHFG